MTMPGRRQAVRLPRQQRVAEIMRAARAVFIEKGYEEALLSDIAERADVVEGSIYRYFENKRDLLVKDADDIFITGNRFVDNSTAVFLDNAPMSRKGRAVLNRNLIARNDVGIALQPLTKRVEIWETLPRSTVGKVLKKDIRQFYWKDTDRSI